MTGKARPSGVIKSCRRCRGEFTADARCIKNKLYCSRHCACMASVEKDRRENPQKHRDEVRRYKKEHPEKKRAEYIKYRDAYLRSNNRWRKNNPDKVSVAAKRGYAKHKEARRRQAREWAKANPGKRCANQRSREARKRKALPAWLTPDDRLAILAKYCGASFLTKRFGFKYHVDHIVPLKNSFVCGLHVPWNLRVIPAELNLSKRNRLDAEY